MRKISYIQPDWLTQLYKGRIKLSDGWIAIQRLSVNKTYCSIHWIELSYSVYSVIHPPSWTTGALQIPTTDSQKALIASTSLLIDIKISDRYSLQCDTIVINNRKLHMTWKWNSFGLMWPCFNECNKRCQTSFTLQLYDFTHNLDTFLFQ